MNKGFKTIEDYKSYYEDSTREQILDDTYIDFIGYQNLAKEYSRLQQENKQLKEKLDKNTEIYLNASKYGSKMEGKVVVLEYILEELKKWLEDEIKTFEIEKETECDFNEKYLINVCILDYRNCLDKIKELEEGVK